MKKLVHLNLNTIKNIISCKAFIITTFLKSLILKNSKFMTLSKITLRTRVTIRLFY